MTLRALPPEDDMDNAVDDIDALIAQLRDVVAARRASGEYPETLEEDLDEHFRMAVPGGVQSLTIDDRLRAVDKASMIGRHRIFTESRIPLGSAVHKTVGRVVVRQTNSLLAQLMEFALAVRLLLHAVVERLPEEDFRDTAARVDLILDKLAAYERVPDTADSVVRALAGRLERLESLMAAMSAPGGRLDDMSPLRTDDAELQATVAGMQLASPVLDLSAEADGAAALAALEARADGTLGSVLLTSGAERFTVQGTRNVVAAAAVKLRAGGALVAVLSEAPVLSDAAVDGRALLTWSPGIAEAFVRELAAKAGFQQVTVHRAGSADEAAPGADVPAPVAEELRRLRARVAELERRTSPYLLVCTR